MRKPFSFDMQYEAALALAEELRPEAKLCADFIAEFARDNAQADDERFLTENGRFQAFVSNGANLTDILAELVSGLDAMTVKVSADLDGFRGLTAGEKLIGKISRQRMWRRHSARVRAAPVVQRLGDLLSKSNALAGLIEKHRVMAAEAHKSAERKLVDIVDHRRRLVDEIDIARMRIRELNAKALNTQGRIGVYGSRAEWDRMEEERRALKAQADGISENEKRMRDDSQRRERFIGLFDMFVDGLNRQVGLCNALIRKLIIDTEERLLIYIAQVDTDVPGSKVRISTEIYPDIAGPISLFERDMLVPQELEMRKRDADANFHKKFPAFAGDHEVEEGVPLIDFARISSRLRIRFPHR